MPRRVLSPISTQDDTYADDRGQGSSQHDSVQDASQSVSDEDTSQSQTFARRKRANTAKLKPKSVKVKPEKSSKSRVCRDPPESVEESENISFDRDEFLATARAVSAKSVETMGGLAMDWKELRHKVQNIGFTLVTDTATAVEEASGDTDQVQQAMDELDAIMRKLIDAEQELTFQEESIKALKQRAASGEIIKNLRDEYAAHVQDAMDAYGKRTARQKYAKHGGYFKFRERVWEVNHEDAMPPINDLIPLEDADTDSESDVEVGGMRQDFKCPLTLTIMVNPMTSQLCDHSFSADAITSYLSGRKKPCPASGCNALLTLGDIVHNKELANRVAAAARRARRREEAIDEEETEVID